MLLFPKCPGIPRVYAPRFTNPGASAPPPSLAPCLSFQGQVNTSSTKETIWALAKRASAQVPTCNDNDKENTMLLKCIASRDNINCWKGEGYYRIAYSDGGQDYTCDGPVWFESYPQAEIAMEDAWQTVTPTHHPYSEYLGVQLSLGDE